MIGCMWSKSANIYLQRIKKKDLHIFASTQKNKVLFNGYVNNNTTGVACGAGTANPYDVPEFTPGF